MIYFAQRSDGRIKIGHTRSSVLHRLRSLSTGAGRLVLLGTIEGTARDERALHARFAADRVEGEWFAITPAAVAEIVGSGAAPAPPSPPQSAREEMADIFRAHVLERETLLRRGAARATLESAPADAIPEILEYVLSRVERRPADDSDAERRIWRAAADAAAAELERIRTERR